jgi:hypothetical protein
MCNTGAESTFKLTRSADVILKHYRHDLMDDERVGDPRKVKLVDDDPRKKQLVEEQTQNLRLFKFQTLL